MEQTNAEVSRFWREFDESINNLQSLALEDEEITTPNEFLFEATKFFVANLLADHKKLKRPGFHISEDGFVSLIWRKGESSRLDVVLFYEPSDDTVSAKVIYSNKKNIESQLVPLSGWNRAKSPTEQTLSLRIALARKFELDPAA